MNIPAPIPCKKCGRLPQIRMRKYTAMIYCSRGCVRLFKKDADEATRAWNEANKSEVKNG